MAVCPGFCDMKITLFKKSVFLSSFVILVLAGITVSQTTETTPKKKVNYGYSQNPKKQEKKESDSPNQAEPENKTGTPDVKVAETNQTNQTNPQKTRVVEKNTSKNGVKPTENYLVGIGDILFINIQNSSKGSTYFTVLNDGTIDYPLAGGMISVSGLTTGEIEDLLREKVKLYENPQISVKVREYSSHKITVLGLVEKSGEKFLQREAVPLFVVRAEAIVHTKADRVVIRRADSTIESFSLKDEKSQNLLIYPNDIVEFAFADQEAAKNGQPQFYFIGGEVWSVGQKNFYEGLTLTQAILTSGGLKKVYVNKIVIRRRNAQGLLVSTKYNLKLIKNGKVPDPVLAAGDTIEVGN